ncbi:hypothetical protein GJR99_03510 [Haloferax sp. MBLA0078]|uniref:Uncharacterized protein n=1 Tax=Haloferax marinum TaxID=2666143 RepID=A0A6A8G3C9_9EURY|nr:hypothetical protein Hfx1150_03530 [Haloferax sp. CBA1150]MRW95641.1 hypothetical protein [Haloferax marinum]
MVAFDPPLTLDAVLVGVFGTLALEAALLSRRTRVRTLWDSGSVRAVAVVSTLVAVAVAVAVVGTAVLVVVLSGVVTYLFVLAVVELRTRLSR